MAYERVNGPLGREYSDEALASINDALSLANKLLGCQLSENPVPDPEVYVRPKKLFDPDRLAKLAAEEEAREKQQDQGFMTQDQIDAEFNRRDAGEA